MLDLMRAPSRAYARLVQQGGSVSALGALRRPALVALTIGTVVAMTATGTVDPRLVARSTMVWAFAVVIQLVAALAIIAPAKRRTVTIPHAVDLLFAGHGPWTLWLLAIAAWAVSLPPLARSMGIVMLSVLLPIGWTIAIVRAFCRTVLHDTPRTATWRTVAHQSLTIGTLITLFCLAVQVWPRIINVFTP